MASHPSLTRKPKQLQFEDKAFFKPKAEFGGSLLTSHPKTKRPLSTTLPIHLCLRSNFSTLKKPKNFGEVHKEIYRCARKYGIKVYKYANVGNHLHLLIKLTKIKLWAQFIRELTSRIASTCDEKLNLLIQSGGHSITENQNKKKFWKHRPFTRIISGWNKAFRTMKSYILLNQYEAEGHISRKDIKTLKDLRLLFEDD